MSLQELKQTHDEVKNYLLQEGGIEQFTTYEALATKSLLIAAAGEMERKFNKLLKDSPISYGSPDFLISFITSQAIERKFHSMFNWKSANINSFAGLFGPVKKAEIIDEFKSLSGQKVIKDFIFIGSERNRIVHKGLATESLDHTFDEVWEKYLSASKILEILEKLLVKKLEPTPPPHARP
tara:strand:- start:150 stop:692 length:543 start_codon:yes stop_codon:yes gene_type:complete